MSIQTQNASTSKSHDYEDLLQFLAMTSAFFWWPVTTGWKALWHEHTLQIYSTMRRQTVVLVGPYDDMLDADYRRACWWCVAAGLAIPIIAVGALIVAPAWWKVTLGFWAAGHLAASFCRGYMEFFTE